MVRYICCVLVYLWHSLQLRRPSLAPNQRLADVRHVSPSARLLVPISALPLNILHHRFYHTLLTSWKQLFTPARKVYDRSCRRIYIHSDNSARLSLLHTKPNRREAGTPSLFEATSVSTVVVLMLLSRSFVITVAKNETVRERYPYSQNWIKAQGLYILQPTKLGLHAPRAVEYETTFRYLSVASFIVYFVLSF